jgi:hypothetical protein
MSDEYDPTEEEVKTKEKCIIYICLFIFFLNSSRTKLAQQEQEQSHGGGGGGDDDGAPKEGEPLGEGWVGVTRPGVKVAPPVADRTGRRQLYTTVAVKAVDTSVFSEVIKSDRVWWTPEDEPEIAEDETPFDVDISGERERKKKSKLQKPTKRTSPIPPSTLQIMVLLLAIPLVKLLVVAISS